MAPSITTFSHLLYVLKCLYIMKELFAVEEEVQVEAL